MAGKGSSVTAIGFISSGLTAAVAPLVFVAVIGAIVAIFVVGAALLSIVGGLLIALLSRQQSGTQPGWMQSYEAAFIGYTYALIGHLLWLWLTSGLAAAATFGGTVGIDPQSLGDVFSWPVLRILLGWLWPAIFISAAVLSVKAPMYGGPSGYLRAVLVCLVSLPLSLLLPLAVLMGLDQRLAGIGGMDGMAEALLGLSVMLCIHAALGGLLAGTVLYGLSRVLDPAGPRSVRRIYVSAFLALLAWGALTSIVIFLLPVFDPFADALTAMAKMDSPLPYLQQSPGLLPAAVGTFAVLQVPGLLASGRVLAARHGSSRPGPAHFWKSVGVSAIAVTVTLPLVVILAWLLVSATP